MLQLTTLGARLGAGCAARVALPALASERVLDASLPSCSYRAYATEGDEQAASKPRARRPMRHGSRLAIRDPARFRRMRAILGYPDDASNGKVEHVTISLLQTIKYLLPEEQRHLNALASYKVTTLNRELLPLLEQTKQLLHAPAAPATDGATQKAAVSGAKKK